MKKLLALAAAGAALLSSALAASYTIEFTRADGTVQVWTFNGDGTATGPGGAAATYTWDEASNTLCAAPTADASKQTCVTFEIENPEPKVGDTTPYKTSEGVTGVAKILAIGA